MDATVIIPTYRRGEKLAACLRSLAAQEGVSGGFEVLVGFDGADSAGHQLAQAAWDTTPTANRGTLALHTLPRSGLTRIRNALLTHATGRILISTNDDIVASPRFVAEHVQAHSAARTNNQRIVVSGDSRWKTPTDDTAWDRLVRETPLIFFDRIMREAGHAADKDWGFRHAWGLNMSAELAAVREVNGFTPFPAWYGYEDNELAFKLNARFGAVPVIYRPDAALVHDHRVTAKEYIRREYTLGFAALGFAQTSPACALAMFGRDITSADEHAYCKLVARNEASAARRVWAPFQSLERCPAASIDGARLDAEYRAHIPLKRWAWRTGLLDAFENREANAPGFIAALTN